MSSFVRKEGCKLSSGWKKWQAPRHEPCLSRDALLIQKTFQVLDTKRLNKHKKMCSTICCLLLIDDQRISGIFPRQENTQPVGWNRETLCKCAFYKSLKSFVLHLSVHQKTRLYIEFTCCCTDTQITTAAFNDVLMTATLCAVEFWHLIGQEVLIDKS